MARKEKAPKTGLTTKHWFGYMFGDWGGCMTFTLMASIFGLYCTNVLGINPTLMGTLTLIWTIWDAINDPMMGALMDKAFAKNQNKRGKFRPWLLRATPLLAISAICLWTVPTFLEGIPMLIALFSFKILYEASYTMFNIPMGSLLSAMSTNDAERASLSSARGVGSMFGNMIPAMAGPIIIGLWDDRTSTGYMITGVTCAIIGFVICFLHYALTEERTVVGEDVKADDIKFTDILQVFLKNRPFVALCIHGVCICLMQYAAQTLGLYMYSGVYHDVTYQSIASALSSPFMIGSMIAVPFMCKKLGLEKLIRCSLLIGGAICPALFALHLVFNIHPLVHGVLLGLGSGFAMVSIQMQWGLVGEAIDYNEYITGKRTEGSIYGTFNLSRRIGQAIGSGFAFYALAWIGYDGTAAVQSAGTVLGLKALCVLVPAVIVCPGGGYVYCSPREGEPVALRYAAKGFHAFVLRYSTGFDAKDFAPWKEVDWAIGYIREHGEEWHIDPEKIVTCGFSAGGRVAFAAGLMGENKPNAMVLNYPAVQLPNLPGVDYMIKLLTNKAVGE